MSHIRGTHVSGRTFQVVNAQERGDLCYEGKKGWYWHLLTEKSAIDTSSLQGPFDNMAAALQDAELPEEFEDDTAEIQNARG